MRSFLFLLASARPGGNSEDLARAAAEGLPAGSEARWWSLAARPLPPFVDRRHAGGFRPPRGRARELAEATLAATDLVLVTPVYWYALPAAAKLYFDHWTGWMRVPSLDFRARMRHKRLWAVVADAGEPGEDTASLLLEGLVRTADYLELEWMGALQGHGSAPGEALREPGVRDGIRTFFTGSRG